MSARVCVSSSVRFESLAVLMISLGPFPLRSVAFGPPFPSPPTALRAARVCVRRHPGRCVAALLCTVRFPCPAPNARLARTRVGRGRSVPCPCLAAGRRLSSKHGREEQQQQGAGGAGGGPKEGRRLRRRAAAGARARSGGRRAPAHVRAHAHTGAIAQRGGGRSPLSRPCAHPRSSARQVRYNRRDALIYALGLGADELRFTYELGKRGPAAGEAQRPAHAAPPTDGRAHSADPAFAVLPTYPVVFSFKGAARRTPGPGRTRTRSAHARAGPPRDPAARVGRRVVRHCAVWRAEPVPQKAGGRHGRRHPGLSAGGSAPRPARPS